MSDDETRTLEPDAPVPPQPGHTAPGQPSYAGPPAHTERRFVDRVLDMRAVIAVALAALIIGGLSGFILGEHTNGGDDGFGRGPGGFRGGMPGSEQFPGGPPGQQQGPQQFGPGQNGG
jgi:hypothetical protein